MNSRVRQEIGLLGQGPYVSRQVQINRVHTTQVYVTKGVEGGEIDGLKKSSGHEIYVGFVSVVSLQIEGLPKCRKIFFVL